MAPRSSSRPVSSPRSPPKRTIVLPSLTEASPGPNAFAQQAVQMDKYRMDSNAFYQKEVQQRGVTPSTDSTTAARHRGLSESHMMRTPRVGTMGRESHVTTMSPFINAGKPDTPQLVPYDAFHAEPTGRGFIEERHEQQVHVASGSEEERTPVYIYTPKTNAMGFDKPMSMQRSQSTKEVTFAEPPKSPKKSLFDRFRKPLSNISSPSTSTLGSLGPAPENMDPPLPPKAKAVLGSPIPSQGILRSPSRRKGFFSSRNKHPKAVNVSTSLWNQRSTGPQPEDYDDQLHTANSPMRAAQGAFSKPLLSSHEPSVNNSAQPRLERHNAHRYIGHIAGKTPQTGSSDPGSQQGGFHHNSGTFRHESVRSGNDVARSQSLKYFDHSSPPTPPAKNTPPEQKQAQQPVTKVSGAFDHSEAAHSPDTQVCISTADNVSPTRYGTYGQRTAPRLVTKPSMYSMHASVVPEMTDASIFEKLKSRVDGLGLEGFSLPAENKHRISPERYSPSVYTDEWQDGRSQFDLKSPVSHSAAGELALGGSSFASKELRNEHSFSTSGSLAVWYPDLGSDPSRQRVITPSTHHYQREQAGASDAHRRGNTHSSDHGGEDSPHRSTDSRLSAPGPDEDTLIVDQDHVSPASMKHPSAMPSPLQFLPATVYTPPVPKARARMVGDVPRYNGVGTSNTGSGLHERNQDRSVPPVRTPDPLDTAPVLESSPKGADPHYSVRKDSDPFGDEADPIKYSPSLSLPSEKLDRILALLSNVTPTESVDTIREEMRQTHSRLDERLAAMEQHLQASPNTNPTSGPALDDIAGKAGSPRPSREAIAGQAAPQQRRIATQIGPAPPPAAIAVPSTAKKPLRTRSGLDAIKPALPLPSPSPIVYPVPSPIAPPRSYLRVHSNSKPKPLVPTPDATSTSDPEDPAGDTLAGLQATNRQLVAMVHNFSAQLENMEKRMSEQAKERER
nr:hypothetical protein CFP56_54493 [Quercus suber]